MPIDIRTRSEGDLDECLEMLCRCYAVDGYPAGWPPDARDFLAPPYERASWIALEGDLIVGHVALHEPGQDPAYPMARDASGLQHDQLAAVGRLFSSPAHRRRGIGPTLLDTAVETAHAQARRPFLNVGLHLNHAIVLYERSGWTNLGRLLITFPDETTLETLVFLGPAA